MNDRISFVILAFVALILPIVAGYQPIHSQTPASFDGFALVDKVGNIRKPIDFRDRYEALGTSLERVCRVSCILCRQDGYDLGAVLSDSSYQVKPASTELLSGSRERIVCQPPAGPGSGPVKTVTIVVQGFKFDPPIVTVHEGDTVEWKNKDIVPHTVTEDVSKPAFDSGKIQMGAGWSFVARSKGTYNYICTLHPNMHGRLIVQ